MSRILRIVLAAAMLVALATALPAGPALADGAEVRADVIANMMDAGDKVVELAGVVPAGKWAWRPGKGVRSVGEVYLHFAQGNYLLGSMLGNKPPMGMAELQGMDTTPRTPAETIDLIKRSYQFAREAIESVPDDQMSATADFFGRPMTKQAIMLALASHSHEHLGQSIAYARMNGVVPPWTAREQAAAKKAAAEKKAGGDMEHGHQH